MFLKCLMKEKTIFNIYYRKEIQSLYIGILNDVLTNKVNNIKTRKNKLEEIKFILKSLKAIEKYYSIPSNIQEIIKKLEEKV